MKKVRHFLFILLYIGACTVPLFGMLLGYKNINTEKRPLAKPPVLFTAEGFNNSFPEDAEAYLSDHFAFKPQMVTADAVMKQTVFGESVNTQVIVGKDGWLFFEPTLKDYLKVSVLGDNEIYRIAKTLELQKEYLARRDVDFIFTVAPNKASVYPEQMPDRYLSVGELSNCEKLYRQLDAVSFPYLNLHSVLRSGEGQLYHKLDSHWNNLGALAAYRAIIAEVQNNSPEFSFEDYAGATYTSQKIWEGDLSQMLYPALSVKDDQMVYDIGKNYSSARPIRSPEELLINTTSEAGTADLLMFRDSFANALLPFISNSFASVIYSRAIPYQYTLLTEDTDVVLFEIVERNIVNVIQTAPILPSYTVDAIPKATESPIDLTIIIENTDNGTRVVGTAIPEHYDAGQNYDIYLKLTGDAGDFTLVTFPIYETDYLSGTEDKANAAFSARLDESSVPAGTYAVEVIVCGEGEPVSCKSPESTVVISGFLAS